MMRMEKPTPTTSFPTTHPSRTQPLMRLLPTSRLSKKSMSDGGLVHPIHDGAQEWNQRNKRFSQKIRYKDACYLRIDVKRLLQRE